MTKDKKKSAKREPALVNSKVIEALRVRTGLRAGDTPAPAPTGPVKPENPPPRDMV